MTANTARNKLTASLSCTAGTLAAYSVSNAPNITQKGPYVPNTAPPNMLPR